MDFLQKLGIKQINYGACSGPENWIATTDQGQFSSINPSTRNTISSIYACSEQDYEIIVNNSVTAQLEWRNVPAPKRGEIVRCIGEQLRANKDALGNLVSTEMGKIKQEGDGEVQEMIDLADLAVGQARMLYGKTMHSERSNHRMYEQWHPRGVVGVVTAFNFPVAVWAWNALIAAIAGNTVIWKPSRKVALCAIAVQNICNNVMQSFGLSGVFSLFIPSDNTLANKFVEDERIDLISFTGSSKVGRDIATKVAMRMGKSLLECSGNNAIVIDKSADFKLAVPAIVFGAVGTAGQRCTTTRRLIIHNSVYDNLISHLVNAYKQIKIGDPLDQANLLGPLIDTTAVKNFKLAVSTARQQGGQVIYGGHSLDMQGFFVEPTIIEMPEQSDIVRTETFAPILYILRYETLQQAIELHSSVPQGLSSSIFTQNLAIAEYFLSSNGSDCGIANVNIGTSGAEIGGAFGGEKQTGGGREAGSDCWKAYMRRQTNTINWGEDLPLAQGINFDF